MYIYELTDFIQAIDESTTEVTTSSDKEIMAKPITVAVDRPLACLIHDELLNNKSLTDKLTVYTALEHSPDIQVILSGTKPLAGIPVIYLDIKKKESLSLESDSPHTINSFRKLAKKLKELYK